MFISRSSKGSAGVCSGMYSIGKGKSSIANAPRFSGGIQLSSIWCLMRVSYALRARSAVVCCQPACHVKPLVLYNLRPKSGRYSESSNGPLITILRIVRNAVISKPYETFQGMKDACSSHSAVKYLTKLQASPSSPTALLLLNFISKG